MGYYDDTMRKKYPFLPPSFNPGGTAALSRSVAALPQQQQPPPAQYLGEILPAQQPQGQPPALALPPPVLPQKPPDYLPEFIQSRLDRAPVAYGNSENPGEVASPEAAAPPRMNYLPPLPPLSPPETDAPPAENPNGTIAPPAENPNGTITRPRVTASPLERERQINEAERNTPGGRTNPKGFRARAVDALKGFGRGALEGLASGQGLGGALGAGIVGGVRQGIKHDYLGQIEQRQGIARSDERLGQLEKQADEDLGRQVKQAQVDDFKNRAADREADNQRADEALRSRTSYNLSRIQLDMAKMRTAGDKRIVKVLGGRVWKIDPQGNKEPVIDPETNAQMKLTKDFEGLELTDAQISARLGNREQAEATAGRFDASNTNNFNDKQAKHNVELSEAQGEERKAQGEIDALIIRQRAAQADMVRINQEKTQYPAGSNELAALDEEYRNIEIQVNKLTAEGAKWEQVKTAARLKREALEKNAPTPPVEVAAPGNVTRGKAKIQPKVDANKLKALSQGIP